MPAITDPALTYTLEDFIAMQFNDDMTYYNFSILEVINGVQYLNHNLVEDYLDLLIPNCREVELSNLEYKKYRYYPDLLAYHVYGTTQVDFIILLLNDCVDPKEFTKSKIILPYATQLNAFLNDIYSKEYEYIQYNRQIQGI